VEANGGYGRGDDDIPGFGRAASLPRFGDLSVGWWRPSDPQGVAKPGDLASRAAKEVFGRVRGAVVEGGQGERAKDAKLERVGSGPYLANKRYLVGAILGLCGGRDYGRHDGKKKRRKAGVPLVVRCKHLIAAQEEAEEYAEGAGEGSRPGRAAPGPAPTQKRVIKPSEA
jgi:hypothetical protein